jgi:hypothetical protein
MEHESRRLGLINQNNCLSRHPCEYRLANEVNMLPSNGGKPLFLSPFLDQSLDSADKAPIELSILPPLTFTIVVMVTIGLGHERQRF